MQSYPSSVLVECTLQHGWPLKVDFLLCSVPIKASWTL